MKPGIEYIGVGCGALIINDKNQVLLVRRGSESKNQVGVWSKPGGTVEFGETAEDATKREIKEELGVDIELIRPLDFTNHIMKDEKQHWVAINFLAKIVNGTPKIMEQGKHDGLEWFNLDKLPDKLSQTTSEPIRQYLKILKS